jgi:hypothetical protein
VDGKASAKIRGRGGGWGWAGGVVDKHGSIAKYGYCGFNQLSHLHERRFGRTFTVGQCTRYDLDKLSFLRCNETANSEQQKEKEKLRVIL